MQDFNWDDRQIKYAPEFVQAIVEERGISEATLEGLFARRFIGGIYVQKWQEPCVAFPICDENGKIYRAHCRRWENKEWVYEPSHDPQTRPISALVYGDFEKATKIYVFESQWDAIALIDILRLFNEIDAGEVCLVSTRGAQKCGCLKPFAWTRKNAVIYVLVQNDNAGRQWLQNVLKIIGGAYVVETPAPYNDLGEWVKAGHATAFDIEGAIEHAEFRRHGLKDDDDHAEPEPLQQVEFPPMARRPCFCCYDRPFMVDSKHYKAGVYSHFVKTEENESGDEVDVPVDLWICSVMRVLHIVRTDFGNEHAYLIEYVPHGETQPRRAVLLQSLLLGRGDEDCAGSASVCSATRLN